MVNTTEQGEIPVAVEGGGFKVRQKGAFTPGEYRQLVNCEVVDGIVRNRRNIRATTIVGNTQTAMLNQQGFVGYANGRVFTAGLTTQYFSSGLFGGQFTTWAPTSLPTDGNGSSYHKIVGVYYYNDTYYWITFEYKHATLTSTIHLYSLTEADLQTLSLGNMNAILFGNITHEGEVLTTGLATFKNFFIQGERLWIVMGDRIYFSAATDHTDFTVPSGGFFDFQSQKFNFALFHRNTIYALTTNAIFTITYTSDPNLDSQATQIADHLGAEHGVVHQDTVYVVNADAIYAIVNNSMEKVIANKFDYGGNSAYKFKLVSFLDYIVVIKRMEFTYTGASSLDSFGYYKGKAFRFEPDSFGFNILDTNVIFINTSNGSVHTVMFKDSHDNAAVKQGWIVDAFLAYDNDSVTSKRYLFFLTNRFNQTSGPGTEYKSNMYAMDPAVEPSDLVYDAVCQDSGLVNRQKPNYILEIDSYTPDGTEYVMKKFRHLQAMGQFPLDDFQLEVAYDNEDYQDPITITTDRSAIDAVGEARPHYPMHVGLNQRGRSLSIKFSTVDYETPLGSSDIYEHFQLSHLETLWTYSLRGNQYRTPTITT